MGYPLYPRSCTCLRARTSNKKEEEEGKCGGAEEEQPSSPANRGSVDGRSRGDDITVTRGSRPFMPADRRDCQPQQHDKYICVKQGHESLRTSASFVVMYVLFESSLCRWRRMSMCQLSPSPRCHGNRIHVEDRLPPNEKCCHVCPPLTVGRKRGF